MRNSGALCIDTLATVAQLILSILPRAYRRHIENGVMAPFKSSGCIDFQFENVRNRCNSPRTKFGIVSLPYHGVPPLFDTMGISDPSMTTIPIENSAFIHHFRVSSRELLGCLETIV